jgi:murein DD-endopeptidase MepM/ murein hydrolase activator NlpD
MKRALLFLLLIFTAYVILSLYLLDKHTFLCPVKYSGDFIIRSDSMGEGLFATRRSGGRMHQGIDLLAESGDPVMAVRCGLVIFAGSSKGMGNYVILRHSPVFTSIYGHLSAIYVRKGQILRQGDYLGAVGKTGNANYRNMRPHLHLEIRKYNIPQDPLSYLD